jgi:hypothetical protein
MKFPFLVFLEGCVIVRDQVVHPHLNLQKEKYGKVWKSIQLIIWYYLDIPQFSDNNIYSIKLPIQRSPKITATVYDTTPIYSLKSLFLGFPCLFSSALKPGSLGMDEMVLGSGHAILEGPCSSMCWHVLTIFQSNQWGYNKWGFIMLYHDWIGLREILQETIDFPIKYGAFR